MKRSRNRIDDGGIAALGEVVVSRSLRSGELVPMLGEGRAQAVAGLTRGDRLEQGGGKLEFVLRGDRRVEEQRDSTLLGLLGADVELMRYQGSQGQQREGDAGVTDGQQPGGIVGVALGQELPGQGGEGQPHAHTGQRLRDRGPGNARLREPRQRQHPGGDQGAAGGRPQLGGAAAFAQAGERGHGQHRHHQRRPDRRRAPAGHQD